MDQPCHYMYLNYTIALGGVIMTIITIKINLQNAKFVQLEANLRLKRPLVETAQCGDEKVGGL